MRFLLVAALLLTFTSVADAQVSQGTQEIGLTGNATVYDGRSAASVSVQYGYFVTRALEIGPRLSLGRASFHASEGGPRQSYAGGTLGAFTHLHLGPTDARLIPFVGAGFDLGFGFQRDFAESAQYGVLGGAKFFLTPGGAITPAAFYRAESNGDSAYGLQLWISLFF